MRVRPLGFILLEVVGKLLGEEVPVLPPRRQPAWPQPVLQAVKICTQNPAVGASLVADRSFRWCV